MKLEVPKLMDYSAAINANQSMMDGFSKLGSISQDYAKMEEQKKQNIFDQKEQSFSNAIKQQELDFKNNQEASKKQANTEALKFVNPELFQSIQSQYGQTPTIENANKMNDITGNIDLDKVKPVKPSYKLEKTDSGFVMFNTANPEAQPIPVGGNYKPYSKPISVSGASIEKKTAYNGVFEQCFQKYLNTFSKNKF